jgi:O-antigen/teichoic acid export membrane protein
MGISDNYFFRWLRDHEFAGNVFKLISGTAFGQLVTILISPILTRLYSANDFGILAIYISFAGILAVIITLRFEDAIVLPSNDNQAVDLAILGLGISFTFSFLFFMIFLLFRSPILNLLKQPELGIYLFLIPLSTFFYGSYQVLSYWMSRKRQFNPLAASKTIKEISTGGIQLGFGGIYYTGSLGLIIGQILGNASAAGFLFFKSVADLRPRFTSELFKNLRNVFVSYKQFPLYTTWAALTSSLSQNLPAILLAVFFSPAIAGYFAIATRVLTVPSILIGNSVRQVYYPKASELRNEGKSIFKLFKSTTMTLIYIGLIPTGIIGIWGEPLFLVVFGESWGEAGLYAAILSPALFIGFINPPAVMNLFILKLNHIQLIILIIALILRVLAIYVGYAFFDNVYYSIGLYSLVGVLSNIFLIGYVYFKLK